MGTIKYFWKCAIRSARRGKFNYRAWNQLYLILCLNAVCLLTTGHFLDNLDK